MRRLWLVLAMVVPAVAGGWIVRGLAPANGAKLFAAVLQRVQADAPGGVAGGGADEGAPEELARYSREELRGSYGGLGMLIQDQNGAITVTQVFPHSPAQNGGVLARDRIVVVNGQRVVGLRIDSV